MLWTGVWFPQAYDTASQQDDSVKGGSKGEIINILNEAEIGKFISPFSSTRTRIWPDRLKVLGECCDGEGLNLFLCAALFVSVSEH